MIDLSIAIQHHPVRAELLPTLIERIGEAEVVADPEPRGKRSPLRTYLLALERTPATATHRLILQDDTRPVMGFRARAEQAIAEHPDALVCFFVSGALADRRREIIQAHADGERWYKMRHALAGYCPTVATAWPRELVEQFLTWLPTRAHVHKRIDDGAVGSFCKATKPEVWATVPSLVEHPDVEFSIMRQKARAGGNRARVAALFLDD